MKSRKFVLALTGLAMLCVCAAMAAPLATGDGMGRGGMIKDCKCPDGACDGSRIHFALQKMQENGIDTTKLKTALENGDRKAAHAFMQENRPANAPMMGGERIQMIIQKMQEKGIDTTELETALENGDMKAVRAFLQENRPEGAPMMGERIQQMIHRMQENGIDTTELETALENGDMKAVRAFLQENRPAGVGTCQHGVTPTG